jgi:hypothetical protein
VIGLAPPPAVGSPRPGQNLARTAALPDKAAVRGAIAKTVPDDPAPAWPDDSSENNKPGAAKPGLGLGVAKPAASPKKDEAAKSDDFGLDAGVADAARAAQAKPVGGPGAGPSAPTPRTPMASPMAGGFPRGPLPRPGGAAPVVQAPPPKAVPQPSPYGLPLGNEDAETSTLSREELEAARRQAAAAMPPVLADERDVEDEDDESTRAVPRDGLVRSASSPDDHVVVGDSDVVGDDATLAVGPQNNAAAALGNPAALAQTMAAEDSAPWAQNQPNQGWPQQQGGYPQSQPQPGMGGQPNFSAWGQPDPMQQHQPQGSWTPSQPGYSHHGQSMPNAPQSNPHMMGMQPPSGQMSAVPVQGSHVPMQPMQMQQGYPGQPMAQQQPQGQMPWAPHDAGGGRRVRLSGQILLLAIVGVICLAIFITGIVLFATTKF